MFRNINIILEDRSDGIEDGGYFVFNVLHGEDSHLVRIIVYIDNDGVPLNEAEILGAAIVVDGPLPGGTTSLNYLQVLATLEGEGLIDGIDQVFLDIPGMYNISDVPVPYILSQVQDYSEFEDQIIDWIKLLFDEDSALTRYISLINIDNAENTNNS